VSVLWLGSKEMRVLKGAGKMRKEFITQDGDYCAFIKKESEKDD
jgi:hypothetical protein